MSESKELIVAFVDILRRATDSAGRDYWVGRLDDGLVIRRLRANLYGSPEYYSEAGNTPTTYVRAAYRDILGREAALSGPVCSGSAAMRP